MRILVPGRGLEPPQMLLRQLLRLVRLPFRHPGVFLREKRKMRRNKKKINERKIKEENLRDIQNRFNSYNFFSECPVIPVFAVVHRVFSVRFLVLVEMDVEDDDSIFDFTVNMKSRKSRLRQDSHKRHFIPLMLLKSISQATQHIDRIILRMFDKNFHKKEIKVYLH